MNADPNARDRLLNELSSTLTPPSESITDMPPMPPVVPDHDLIRRIGRGSYGEVWLARNVMGSWRAVKIVHRAAFDHDRPYEREFEGIRRFEPVSRTHPSQLNVLHVGRNTASGYFYYVMELADDVTPVFQPANHDESAALDSPTGKSALHAATYSPRTLRSDLLRGGRLPFDECLQIGLALATALDHLHRHGLVHRDIKPSNIIFVNGIPKLADIGLVARAEATLSLVGTEGYLPPEGPGTPQADIFSLGKVLYEMATGRDRHDYPELPTNLLQQPAAERAQLTELNEIIVRACHTDLKQRYQTAAELHADLALLQSGKSVARLRTIERTVSKLKRASLAIAIVTILASAAWLYQSQQTKRVKKLAAENLTLARQAETNAAQARQNELTARENLYAADINLAHQALLADNLRQARVLLQTHVPKPGQPDLRGFEWRYLWQQSQSEELFSLPGHTNRGCRLAFSPDGRRLASGGADGAVKLWDIPSRQEIVTLDCTHEVKALAFSPNGDLLAVATPHSVRLWDTRTFAPLRELTEAIHRAAFSRDGRYLLTSSRTGLIVWQTENWSAAHSYEAPESARQWTEHIGFPASFSPDGKRIAAVFEDAIRLFTVPDLKERSVLPARYAKGPSSGRFVAFSPDNKTLATLSATGFGVQLWDIEGNRELRILSGHSDHVFVGCFSPDGSRLATGGADQTIKLWSVSTGELIRSFKGQADEVLDMTFSPDGNLLGSVGKNDGAVKVWDANARRTPEFFRKPFGPVGFDAEGRLVAFDESLSLVALDPATLETTRVGALELTEGRTYDPWLGNLARDGRTLGLLRQDAKGDVMDVFDASDGKRICSVDAHGMWASFAPKRRLIATEIRTNTVTVWQLPEGTAKWVFTNKVSVFHVVIFSPDENFILTDERSCMKLWRINGEELKLEKVFNSKRNPASGTAFSPDGRLAVTGEEGGLIKLWSMPSGEGAGVLSGHTREVISFAFSPDGRTLASMCDDRTVRLWHVATRRELLRFQAPKEDQRQFELVFSADGCALAARRIDEEGPITWVWYAPSFGEIVVAEGKDYRLEAGRDVTAALPIAKALQRTGRTDEALQAFTEVLQRSAGKDGLAPVRVNALRSRSGLLKHLDRLADAGADNCAVLGIPARDPGTPLQFIDLAPYFNRTLDSGMLSISPHQYLEGLPQGLHAFPGQATVKFDLRGVVRLRNGVEEAYDPHSIERIPVRQKCSRLHFLESARFGEAEDTPVGAYVVHYASGQQVEIPIRYGLHVRDWVVSVDPDKVRDAGVAWIGTDPTKGKIRIFHQIWENPHPGIEIQSLDFVSKLTKCVPVLIAITAEP